MSFDTVLIANRGAIATRIIRTLRQMGLRSVAVYSEADIDSLHVSQADVAVCIGPAPATESYLDTAAILKAAQETGAGAIHPGYGFLAENAEFAESCAAAGIVFIGPTPENIRTFGLKHSARALAAEHGVPLAPGTGLLTDEEEAASAARAIGFPVILKATAGGGGIGMRICEDKAAVRDGFAGVARLGEGNFGDAGVFLERYVGRARHIEVQIFGDGNGRVMPLGERDCSLQRRNQKVVEEAPAPLLPATIRAELIAAAVRLGQAAHYRSAGTVEFLFDAERQQFFFLEMNTRLQVEHGVTEEVMGIDLVEWMILGGAGDFSFMDAEPPVPRGHAIQVRLYAEDPALDYRPTSGTLTAVNFPQDIRAETWVMAGSTVSAWYDPMLAKLIVHAPTREAAISVMQDALDESRIDGIETNLRWLRAVVRNEMFIDGQVSTRLLDTIAYRPRSVRVVSGGTATTVQDWPGRLGLWAIGVPPSGPMDDRSFRIGNRLLGNAEGEAGLEMTVSGPTLFFNAPARLCLTGADFGATLDDVPVGRGTIIDVVAGQTLALGRVSGGGIRGYILFAGGLDIAPYLNSHSTFELGQFGGHAARRLLAGDTLHLGTGEAGTPPAPQPMPDFGETWTLRVLYGPHGAPDFFTDDDIATIVAADWQVHYNSNRTGVRLVGPKPQWARKDGGEAGLHPSNIHDNPYAVGAVDFTGDMPIILGPDGPSLGGFVCPFVVIAADRWKIGQLAPGDRLRFVPVALEDATDADDGPLAPFPLAPVPADMASSQDRSRDIAGLSPILADIPGLGGRPRTVYRQQGDRNILVEYGPIVLDIELRIRVHALMTELERQALPGVIDIVPGIRSLQLHFDGRILDQPSALAALRAAEERLGDLEDFAVPSRIVHLPLSWRDPATIETIEKYMGAVRDDAPWCPDNIEFIRRINGMTDADAVENLIFDASYLVLGLGDVYLGAPVATPVDPRHRLVTTKYNPARTWTPPNVVGIGGAYMCIYGMEGPGGYQLFGRTIQVWNTHRQTDAFIEGKPWLLRFFDQIRFFKVSAEELIEWRRDFPSGRRSIHVEQSEFRLADYRAFLAKNAGSIATFESQRQAAFDEERADWQRSGEFDRVTDLTDGAQAGAVAAAAIEVPDGSDLIEAPFGGSVWKLLVAPGDTVKKGDIIAVIEAMKMECPLESPASGTIAALYMQEKQSLQPGTPMLALRRHP
jgi:urea carboxylase